MGVYNILYTEIVCPHCSTQQHTEVDFRFGAVEGFSYHIGDTLILPRYGDSSHLKNYIGEGWVDCPHCRRDFWVDISVNKGILTRVEINTDKSGYVPKPQPEKIKSIEEEDIFDQLIDKLQSTHHKTSITALEILKERKWLHDSSMRGLHLQGLQLDEVDLRYADWQGVTLTKSKLVHADLVWANLKWIHIENSILQSCGLESANLRRAYCVNSNLDDTSFASAILKQSYFSQVTMKNCNFNLTNLNQARLHQCDLRNSHFSHANLSNTDLSNSDLSGALLFSANLDNTILQNANLSNTDLIMNINQLPDNITTKLKETMLQNEKLHKAFSIEVNKLSNVNALRGATMPDGTKYAGQFNLVGDIQNAQEQNIDINNPKSMAEFYGVPVDLYSGYQNNDN